MIFFQDIVSSEDTGFTQESLKENYALRHIVSLCCALPLLPADKIQMGINVIIDEAFLCGEAIYYQAVPVFHYIEEKWLKMPHKKFSMCGYVDRTNFGWYVHKMLVHFICLMLLLHIFIHSHSEDLRSRITAAVGRSNTGFYSMISEYKILYENAIN